MTWGLSMAPGRSYFHSNEVIFLIDHSSTPTKEDLQMIQVTEAAIKQIKEEVANVKEKVNEPYIRLSMAVG